MSELGGSRLRQGVLLAAALAFLPGWLPGNRLAEANREGNRAYEGKRWEDALQRYTEAQALAPEDPRVAYNVGNVLAREEKPDEALKAWKGVLDRSPSSALQSRAAYNTGNVHFAREKYKEAVEAYQQALLRQSADRDAKRNLELALRKLQEQQDQQSSPKDSGQPQGGEKQGPEDRKDPSSGDQKNENPEQKDPGTSQPRPGEEPTEEDTRGQEGSGASRTDQEKEMERLLDMIQQEEKKALQEEQIRGRAVRRPSDRDW